MTDAERMCKAAIAYADLGFLVLPVWSAHDGRCDCGKADCDSPGKHPHGRHAPHGLKDATRDKAVICSWFSDGQLVNIGIRTGPESGILVLDVDPRHGGDESLKELGPLPDTATVETGGGGWHPYFKYPAGVDIRNSAGKLGLGLDIRANGGYVVAPPSKHVSGREYKWLINPRAGIADLPQHILAKLIENPAPVKANAPVNGIIPKGQRDDTLTSLAGTMRRRGMTEGAILAALREENNNRCDPPLPESQIEKIIRSIGRKEPGQTVSRPKCEPPRLDPFMPFPVASLPQPVARFVADGAKALGCDPSYIALPLVVGLASAIGNTRRIRLKRSWSEPAIIWGAIVGESGTLKSPALEMSLRPVRKRQQTALKEYNLAMKKYEVELMQYEKDQRTWSRPKERGDPPTKPEPPTLERGWCDDTTIEALAVLLQQNWRGLLVIRDELSGWIGGFDRYSQGKGADAAKWLEVFGGRSIMVDRKTGASKIIYVPRAAVSVAGGIQPGVLRRALGVEHKENGLAARLLLTCPPRLPKRWTEDDISPDLERQIACIFEKLYSLQPIADEEGEPQPLCLPLTRDAKSEWIRFYNEHALEQADLTGDLAAVWSKIEGYAPRLALIVHLVRWAADDPTLAATDAVDLVSMEAGISLAKWFGTEARRVYAILGESDEERDQRRLVELIQRKGGSATVRDLMRSARMFLDADVAEQALNELVKAGHGHWQAPPIGPAGGHPTQRFVLALGVDTDTTLDSSTLSGVVSTSTVSTGMDSSDEQEERAAILEYDGNLPRGAAEERAFRSEKGA
jgi:hypothetical protein